jgi:hypothetical protein
MMKLISYDEIDEKLDGLYNHPSSTEDAAFIREYEALVDRLAEDLKAIGSVSVDHDEFGVEVDFSLGKWDTHTRSIIVVCSNPAVFSKKLVDAILKTLKEYPEKYRVILDGQFSHGDPFYVFLDEGGICGWFRSPEKASVFES